jgi:hypothetical protein
VNYSKSQYYIFKWYNGVKGNLRYMIMKNKVVTCFVLIIVLTACIICTGCTSTPNTQSPVQTVPPSGTIPSQPRSPATVTATAAVSSQTTIPATTATSIAQTTATTPAIPVQTLTPEDTSVQPVITPAPGDPSKVLVSYPSLFDAGNSAGLYALLSDNMKQHHPVDTLNNELAAARSNNYTIEKIQVTNQIIEENTAILEVTISWTVTGSPVTSSPRLFMVYENGQWKLDNLIVRPQDT